VNDEYRVQVTGLRELQAALRRINADLPKELKARFLEIARTVSTKASAKVPRITGQAAASVKPHGTLRGASVTGGGARTPYFPWLDFGGGDPHRRGVTPNRSGGEGRRPFVPGGRYLYPAAAEQGSATYDAAQAAVRDVAKKAGFDVQEGV
jgi:hypothetical protein